MKKVILILSMIFIGCSPESLPIEKPKSVQVCYNIIVWTDSPSGDSITIQIQGYNHQVFPVKDYRDYLNKRQICDLSTIK